MCVRARVSLCARLNVCKPGKDGLYHLSPTTLTETLITGLYTSLHLTHWPTHTQTRSRAAAVRDCACGTSSSFSLRFLSLNFPFFFLCVLSFPPMIFRLSPLITFSPLTSSCSSIVPDQRYTIRAHCNIKKEESLEDITASLSSKS